MTARGAKVLALGLWAACLLMTSTAVVFTIANPARTSRAAGIAAGVTVLVFPTVGALIAIRRPRNPIGWLYLSTGLAFGLGALSWELGWWAVATGSGTIHLATLLQAGVGGWWAIAIGTIAPYSLLLFPDGHLPSPRWRIVAWAAALGIGLLLVSTPFFPDATIEIHGAPANPLADSSFANVADPLSGLGAILFFPTIAASIVAVILRLRRAQGIERAQLKWFAFGGGVLTFAMFVGITLDAAGHPEARANVLGFAVMAVPITAGIAMLRHRLYDIDVVIKKTLVFAILVVLLTVVSLFLVVSAGAIVVWHGNGGFWSPSIVIPGAFLLGVLTGPLWRLSRRIADRVVFGGRATAYEVLTEFSERMRDTYATEDVLVRMAAVLGEGTGAEEATIWLWVDNLLRAETTWPPGSDLPTTVPGDAVEIVHQGEPLGALSVRMPANDPINPGKEKLVRDLAAQAGPVLRNVKLIEELRGSRRRIVAAQDEERRKIERNIHDGAQQQLVALTVKARLARQLAERDTAKTVEMLEQIERETQTALEDLRDLARGIYPPLLADRGLVEALESQARKAAIPVTVEPDGLGRYAPDVEAAVYFCALEALNNIAKYAKARSARIGLSASNGSLAFEVTDDGVGFDTAVTGYGTGIQGMADRLAALGGEVEVRSSPGTGTTVRGRIPVEVAR
jgi:signal transduction histidine kinase